MARDENKYVKVVVIDENGKTILKTEPMTEEEIAELQSEQTLGMNYDELVEYLIREEYSVSDELALLRQKDVKADEYQRYYDYAEECKENARRRLGITDEE